MTLSLSMLTFLLCFLLAPFSDLSAKSTKRKKPPVTAGKVIHVPFESLPYDSILGKNKDAIVEYIQAFPMQDYMIYKMPFGSYYLDPINDGIKNSLRNGIQWESLLTRFFHYHARKGSIVLDIGAHIGTHTLEFSKAVGPDGKVYAFEPQPKLFRELFLNMQLNQASNVEFFYGAVGDHNGEVELAPLSQGNEGGTGLSYGSSGHFAELITIDSLHLNNISLMKIDVECFEDNVLHGAKETILRCKPVILVEIMGGYTYQTAPNDVREKIMNTILLLSSYGYDVIRLEHHDYLALPNPT